MFNHYQKNEDVTMTLPKYTDFRKFFKTDFKGTFQYLWAY